MATLVAKWAMPRRSPYSIVLRQEERHELEARAAKYTLPYFEVVRARMILHAAEGLSNDQIAERLGSISIFGSFRRENLIK
jgi:hypothetical protein